MAAKGKAIVFEGKQIDIALAILFAVMALASARWAIEAEDRLVQAVLLGSVPIDILAAYSFLMRRPAFTPTMTDEILVPFLSFLSPTLVLNSVLLLPESFSIPAGAVIAVPGVVLSIYSLTHLKRSFAILPSVRDVVTGGPYRMVRHPLYLGEALYLLGMMMVIFNLVSVMLFLISLALMVLRIKMEEIKMMTNPDYREYAGRVRYRLIPMVY